MNTDILGNDRESHTYYNIKYNHFHHTYISLAHNIGGTSFSILPVRLSSTDYGNPNFKPLKTGDI